MNFESLSGALLNSRSRNPFFYKKQQSVRQVLKKRRCSVPKIYIFLNVKSYEPGITATEMSNAQKLSVPVFNQ